MLQNYLLPLMSLFVFVIGYFSALSLLQHIWSEIKQQHVCFNNVLLLCWIALNGRQQTIFKMKLKEVSKKALVFFYTVSYLNGHRRITFTYWENWRTTTQTLNAPLTLQWSNVKEGHGWPSGPGCAPWGSLSHRWPRIEFSLWPLSCLFLALSTFLSPIKLKV